MRPSLKIIRVLLAGVLILIAATAAQAVTVVAAGNGPLTTAGTWDLTAVCGSGGTLCLLDSVTGATALTTGNLDSTAFVLPANQVDGFAVHLASRAAGSPSNTITLSLRNSTAGSNSISVTLNVSDLDQAANTTITAREGGWYLIVGTPFTPNGTDSYVIRATMSATTTAVNLFTDGTANNWSRFIRRTTTQAPAAGDNMIITGEWTAAATKTNRTVTMDSTAATDYGAASTTLDLPALGISKGGTLTFGSTGSTNYILQLSGYLTVYSGGALNIGTVATPIPRGSTATLQFDCAADGDFGLNMTSGSTTVVQGLSRTTAKNVVSTLLTATLTSGTNSATIADNTGWLMGDEVGIASTTRTPGDAEVLTLSGDAGATSLAFTGNAVSTHIGSTLERAQAEVVLLTRNVVIRSVSTTAMAWTQAQTRASFNGAWFQLRYVSTTKAKAAVNIQTAASGSFTMQYANLRDTESFGMVLCPGNTCATLSTGVVDIEHTTGFNLDTVDVAANGSFFSADASSQLTSTFILNDMVAIGKATPSTGRPLFQFLDTSTSYAGVTITNLSASSGMLGIAFTGASTKNLGGGTIGPFYTHSNLSQGFEFTLASIADGTIDTLVTWRNAGMGVQSGTSSSEYGITWNKISSFGNATTNMDFVGCNFYGVRFKVLNAYGDTGFASSIGVQWQSCLLTNTRIDKGEFGTAGSSSIWTTHTSEDWDFGLGANWIQLIATNIKFSSTTDIHQFTNTVDGPSWLRFERFGQTNAVHKTLMREGTLAYETGTVDVSPSLKMTPLSATLKLRSDAYTDDGGILIPVDSGQTPTVSVKVEEDGTYNGNPPRLMLQANSALGQDTDVVVATYSGATGSFRTLTGVLPAAGDNGVWKLYVDCDGTAGNIYVDTVTVTASDFNDGTFKRWMSGTVVDGLLAVGAVGTVGYRNWSSGLPFVSLHSGTGVDVGGPRTLGFNALNLAP